jgi:adenine-specific DNA-methyltransferase
VTDLADLPSVLGIAQALLREASLSAVETRLLAAASGSVRSATVAATIAAVRGGGDPLGDAFCRIHSAESRRSQGQTFTPNDVVSGMFAWALRQGKPVQRLVDPGAGTGRYTLAGLRAFPQAHAVAVEMDPTVALLLRANLAAAGLAERATVVVGDFRALRLEPIAGATLFCGNPPYVRHHAIGPTWKAWYSATLAKFGLQGSQLAGLHLHFFLKTRELAVPGDLGCFVTAAEWLDVNYGRSLRQMLVNGLGGTDVFVADPQLPVFSDAMVSAAIAGFLPGAKRTALRFSSVRDAEALKTLPAGQPVALDVLRAEPKWSIFVKGERTERPAGHVELGEFFQVSRGQVTGLNRVWVASHDTPVVPERYLLPSITDAADITAAPSHEISGLDRLRRVVSLPRELDALLPDEADRVDAFLAWARSCGADQTYIARHRKPWWHVHLRDAAPVVMTYMGRRPPVFACNPAGARLINVAHGLYPRQPIGAPALRKLVTWLNQNVRQDAGRSYAGGLTKFEPGEAMRIMIPQALVA